MLSDEKFHERAEKFSLLKSCDNKYFSYEEYRKMVEPNQTDKYKKVVYLYTTNMEEQYSYIESAKNRGYDVLLFDCQLDAHFVNHLEAKLKDTSFARVDSAHVDKLIQKDDISKPELSEDELEDISNVFESVLPAGNHYNVTVENLSESDNAVLVTQSEFMRRYREMSALGGGMNFYGSLPESYDIIVNNNHPLIKRIFTDKDSQLKESILNIATKTEEPKRRLDSLNEKIGKLKPEEVETADKDERESLEKELKLIKEERKSLLSGFGKENDLVKQVCDLALLSNGMLKGEELSKFIKRSFSLIS